MKISVAEEKNRLTREEALGLYTKGSAWISKEESVKGTLEVGMYADFALLDRDYFSIPEEEIRDLESVLTVVDGKIVYGSGPYAELSPEIPEVIPEWSPVKYYGGYQK